MSTEATGLEGVVAFATEISEPDRDGGALRYRGVDLGELAGRVPFERVWGLLVDGDPDPGLVPAGEDVLPVRSGDAARRPPGRRRDAGTRVGRRAAHRHRRRRQTRDDLARTSSALLSFAAQSARGADLAPVPPAVVDEGRTLAERFLLAWRGELDPADAQAIDAYWVSAAEHGMNASTFTARVVASTGADAPAALSAAIGALSGPLHGGAPSRVLRMLDEVERSGDAAGWVKAALDRGERIMGFGHRVYRAEDPRARVLRRAARELDAPRFDAAEALERAALEELRARKPDRVLATNVEYWSAVVLDRASVPQDLFTALFACARSAGWSAHVLEQRRTGRLVRPTAVYVGPEHRTLELMSR